MTYALLFGNGDYAGFKSKVLKIAIKACEESTAYNAVLELDGNTYKNKVYENDKPWTNIFNRVYTMPLTMEDE